MTDNIREPVFFGAVAAIANLLNSSDCFPFFILFAATGDDHIAIACKSP